MIPEEAAPAVPHAPGPALGSLVGPLTTAAVWSRRLLVGTGLTAGGHVAGLPALPTPAAALLAVAVWAGAEALRLLPALTGRPPADPVVGSGPPAGGSTA